MEIWCFKNSYETQSSKGSISWIISSDPPHHKMFIDGCLDLFIWHTAHRNFSDYLHCALRISSWTSLENWFQVLFNPLPDVILLLRREVQTDIYSFKITIDVVVPFLITIYPRRFLICTCLFRAMYKKLILFSEVGPPPIIIAKNRW